MPARDEAKSLLKSLGEEYERLPYVELRRRVPEHNGWPPARTRTLLGTDVFLQPSLDIVEGRRERVTVEIFISGEAVDRWRVKPCYYFEKYPNGRIERFDRFGWQDAVLWFLFLGGIAAAAFLAVELARSW